MSFDPTGQPPSFISMQRELRMFILELDFAAVVAQPRNRFLRVLTTAQLFADAIAPLAKAEEEAILAAGGHVPPPPLI